MTHEQLEQIRAYIKDAVSVIQRVVEENGQPKRGGVRVEFGENSGQVHLAEYDDFFNLYHQEREALAALPSASDAKQACEACSPNLNDPRDRIHDLNAIVYETLLRFGLQVNDDSINALILSHENLWASGTVELQSEAAISGLTGDIEKIQLSNEVELLRFTPASKTAYWNEDAVHFSLMNRVFFADILMSTYYLSVKERLSSNPQTLFAPNDGKLFAAISALRLTLRGCPGIVTIRKRYVPLPGAVTGSGINPALNELASYSRGGTCRLEEADRDALILTYRQLIAERLPPVFRLALRRFNQSFERRLAEDSVVDLAVCVEATLLFGINKGEAGLRMRLIGASLLGNTVTGKDLLFKNLYRARNEIVHAAKSLREIFPQERSDEVLLRFQELVRQTLRRYLERISTGESVEQVNNALLTAIVARFE